MQKFLMLFANPSRTERLNFDKEFRNIQDNLENTNSNIQLINVGKVKKTDLDFKFSRHKPVLVQFSGHGSSDSEIVLEDENGRPDIVDRDLLETVFKHHRGVIKCVILACCYAEKQALAISKHIPYVIGMKGTVTESVSRLFSATFINGLAAGLTMQDAFDRAKTEIGLVNKSNLKIPKLYQQKGCDAKVFRIVETPIIMARFQTDKKGNPLLNKEYKGYTLYKMNIFIRHAPPETSVVLYQYLEPEWDLAKQVEEVEHHTLEFTDSLDEDGDIEIRATLWSPLGGIALKTNLSQALRNFYQRRMSSAVAAAINKIETNR